MFLRNQKQVHKVNQAVTPSPLLLTKKGATGAEERIDRGMTSKVQHNIQFKLADDEVIDLTGDNPMQDVSTAKRARISTPKTSPSSSDRPPRLEKESVTPRFNLIELVANYSGDPPVLQAEQPQAHCSSANIKMEATDSSKAHGIADGNHDGSETQGTTSTPQFKNVGRRIARVSSTASDAQKIKSKLNSTINALKGQSKENHEKTKKPRNPNHVQAAVPKTKRSRTVAKRNDHRSPEQIRMLEARFATNPNPKPSEFHAISEETELTLRDVKTWFSAQRKKCTLNSSSTPNSTSADPIDELLMSSQPGTSGTQNFCPAYDTSNTEQGLTKIKFIRYPNDRVDDCQLIRRDVNQVPKYDSVKLQNLLNERWEIKADRILYLVTCQRTDYAGYKATIYKEAKRIVEIASNVDPFSDKQTSVIQKWKESFIERACQQYKSTPKERIIDVVHNAIMPWVGPFVYSKITQQDGRYLSLLVGLTDFCKISSGGAEGSTWKWDTPVLLQSDLRKADEVVIE